MRFRILLQTTVTPCTIRQNVGSVWQIFCRTLYNAYAPALRTVKRVPIVLLTENSRTFSGP